MIAIDTENLNDLVYSGVFNLKEYITEEGTEIKYILTSLEYDNDILLKEHIPKRARVLSKIPCTDNLDLTVEFNRLALGVGIDQYCILLDANGSSIKEHKDSIIRASNVYEIGLYNITKVEDIIEFSEEIVKPSYVEIDINPLVYPKTIIDYCHENNIQIISHGIFGGKYWAGYLGSMFPRGFLYDFAWFNSDIQEVPGDDLYFLLEISKRSTNKEEEKLCKFSKDINKLPALTIPPQKIHGKTRFNIPGVGKISIECGNESDTYSLEKYTIDVDVENIIWEDKDLPRDIDRNNYNLLGCFHRYHVPVFLDEKYNQKLWKKVYKKVAPDFWIIKLIPKKWYLGWIMKEYVFWLVSGKLIEIPLKAHQNLINDNINI